MRIEVSKLTKKEASDLQDALLEHWDGWHDASITHEKPKKTKDYMITAGGEGFLGGGCGSDDFATMVARDIWTSLGRFVPVEVLATYLEDLPYDRYSFIKEDYEDLKGDDE
jgi:hypothetical protein